LLFLLFQQFLEVGSTTDNNMVTIIVSNMVTIIVSNIVTSNMTIKTF